jgi:hypothetical protein
MKNVGLLFIITGSLFLALLGIMFWIEHQPLAREGRIASFEVIEHIELKRAAGGQTHSLVVRLPHSPADLEVPTSVRADYAERFPVGSRVNLFHSPADPFKNRAGDKVDQVAAGELNPQALLEDERRLAGQVAMLGGSIVLLGMLLMLLMLFSRRRN